MTNWYHESLLLVLFNIYYAIHINKKGGGLLVTICSSWLLVRESLFIRLCNIQTLLIFDPFFFLPIETSGAGGGLFGQQTSTASGVGLFGGATTTPQQTTGGGGLFGSTAAGTGASSFLKPAGGAFGTAASTESTGRLCGCSCCVCRIVFVVTWVKINLYHLYITAFPFPTSQ